MNIQSFAKQDIALGQLETALELYFSRGDLFSVITLAGASEEILGQLLQQRSGSRGLGGTLSSIFEILRPRNRKKQDEEGLSGQEIGNQVHLDLQREAVFLLGRAIEDYIALAGAPSASMLKFMSEVSLQGK
jgi:hypothetical protein